MLGWFLFSGYGQTDTISKSSYENMSEHKKFHVKAQKYELAVDPYIDPRWGMLSMRDAIWRDA